MAVSHFLKEGPAKTEKADISKCEEAEEEFQYIDIMV